MDWKFIVEICLTVLSFFLATISVITVLVGLKQNSKQLKYNEIQLHEIQKEHQLAKQPLLFCMDPKFEIEAPRFFYSPPQKQYSLQSRYRFNIKTQNISDAPAICVDGLASITLKRNGKVIKEDSITHRINIIADNYEGQYSFMFSGDIQGTIFDALSDIDIDCFPRISLTLYFKNTSGGCFKTENSYIALLKESQKPLLKSWHTIIRSAEAEYKEELSLLRNNLGNRDELFSRVKDRLKAKVNIEDTIVIDCEEVLEEYNYITIDEDEYTAVTKQFSYPKIVGGAIPICESKGDS